jgi:hypothetical protein
MKRFNYQGEENTYKEAIEILHLDFINEMKFVELYRKIRPHKRY